MGASDTTVSAEAPDVDDATAPSVATTAPAQSPSLPQRSNVHRPPDVHIIQGDESADNDSTDEHDTSSVSKDGVMRRFLTMLTAQLQSELSGKYVIMLYNFHMFLSPLSRSLCLALSLCLSLFLSVTLSLSLDLFLSLPLHQMFLYIYVNHSMYTYV